MKKVTYLFAVVALSVGFASCNNDDDHNLENTTPNLELRAANLGFTDIASYQASVAEQCAAGNHENCDIKSDGTHNACAYADHSGTKHDGTHHNGSDHGTHDANGHSHGSHEGGTHH